MIRPVARLLAAAAIALLALGCVDPNSAGGDSGNTALYVHAAEGSTAKVHVFGNVDQLYASPGTATPSRTILSTVLDGAIPLAWGGLALDSLGNRLYAVGEAGKVVRIDRLRSQNGTIDSASVDVVSFELGTSSSDRLSSGTFGQAAFDASSGNLYVTESNATDTRIWVVANPSTVAKDAKIAFAGLAIPSGDKQGTGIAVSQGSVFAYFGDGSVITSGADSYSGARLRKGTSSGFAAASNVIIGTTLTGLGNYGSLAYDSGNGYLFVARHNVDSAGTGNPISLFRSGQFTTGGFDVAPLTTFGDPSTHLNLRVIAHPGNRDWLAALPSNAGVGGTLFWVWKAPAGTAPVAVQSAIPGSGIARGIAFDGNN